MSYFINAHDLLTDIFFGESFKTPLVFVHLYNKSHYHTKASYPW